MYQAIDTLNSAFTFITTAYIYLMAIAIPLFLIWQAIEEYNKRNAVSDEFYQQTKVLLAVEPEKTDVPQGKALVLTVETDPWETSDFSQMNIRTIREYVRTNSLQQMIKEAIGKSVAKCTLAELRSALMESQLADSQFRVVCDRYR